MEELRELIGEGERIRTDLADSLRTDKKASNSWDTVVRWYSEALAFAKNRSSRPFDDFPEYLDDIGDKGEPPPEIERRNLHYQRIDRLLNRLHGIQNRENSN
jgi:hypothetical protein